MIYDIQEALARLLEPDASIRKVLLDREPPTYDIDTLYIFPSEPTREIPFETATETDPVTRRQEFTLECVLVVDDEGDMAVQEVSEDLARRLDDKRGAYMRAVRVNQVNPTWDHLRAMTGREPLPLDKRSAAVRVTGWRIVQ